MGQGRGDRIDPRWNFSCQQFDAGSHKLGWRFRKAQARWSQRNGVASSGLGYVCMIFSSLEQVFAHSRSAFNYGSWLWDCALGQRRLRRRAEFNCFFSQKQEHGCSKPHVFPLPPFCKDRRVVEYTMGDLSEDSSTCIARGVNLVQSALNMLHGGQKSKFDFVSAAHQRIQTRLESGWKDMLMDFTSMDVTAIHEFLKHQEHYAGGGPAIPLGSKGGVPSSAATVDLHSHLHEHFPDLAAYFFSLAGAVFGERIARHSTGVFSKECRRSLFFEPRNANAFLDMGKTHSLPAGRPRCGQNNL